MPSKEKTLAFIAHQSWMGKYGRAPKGWGEPEYTSLARAVTRLGQADAETAWKNFLASDDAFVTKRRHSPKQFIADLERWLAPAPVSGKSEWATHSDLHPQRGAASPAMQRRKELMLEAKARGDKDPRLSSLAAWRAEGWEEKTRSGNEQAKG